MTRPTAMDDIPRIEATARLAGELFRLLDGVCSGPAGRLLRRAVDADGRPLVANAQVRGRVVWVAPALVELIRGLLAACPASPCPHCRQAGCPKCGNVGYTPRRPNLLRTAPAPATLPVTGDVEDVWGWLREVEHGNTDAFDPGV